MLKQVPFVSHNKMYIRNRYYSILVLEIFGTLSLKLSKIPFKIFI